MISICTVILEPAYKFLDIYKESILQRTSLISEVIICDLEKPNDFYKEEKNGHINFKFIGPPRTRFNIKQFGHPFGLHHCMEKATCDYILLNDPDTFMFKDIDKFYIEVYNKYDLTFIGTSHHNAVLSCYAYAPCVVNLLMHRSKMPSKHFLDGMITPKTINLTEESWQKEELKGKYLMWGEIPEIMHLYPNPTGVCDTGSHLWYWTHKTNGTWLSFQTPDIHLYKTKYYRSNNKNIKANFGNRPLLWHATSGADSRTPYWEMFKENYEKSKMDDEP